MVVECKLIVPNAIRVALAVDERGWRTIGWVSGGTFATPRRFDDSPPPAEQELR